MGRSDHRPPANVLFLVRQGPMHLSIILPVLNEASIIEDSLRRLIELAPEAERIVVDGGSTDDTPVIAAELATVVPSEPGRAVQLNTGARAAAGDWLLFLHADTRLPEGFEDALTEAYGQGYRIGVFRLRIRGRHWLLPLVGWSATMRSRWRHIALGDQAPFMRREFFERRGGFPELALMEDYAFFRALRRDRVDFYLSSMAVETSGRRWDQHGFWRTWWQMRRFFWFFDRGRDPAELAARYRRIR